MSWVLTLPRPRGRKIESLKITEMSESTLLVLLAVAPLRHAVVRHQLQADPAWNRGMRRPNCEQDEGLLGQGKFRAPSLHMRGQICDDLMLELPFTASTGSQMQRPRLGTLAGLHYTTSHVRLTARPHVGSSINDTHNTSRGGQTDISSIRRSCSCLPRLHFARQFFSSSCTTCSTTKCKATWPEGLGFHLALFQVAASLERWVVMQVNTAFQMEIFSLQATMRPVEHG